jgi:hypothetical protein
MSETEGNSREERHNTSLMDPKEENAALKRKIAVVEQESVILWRLLNGTLKSGRNYREILRFSQQST